MNVIFIILLAAALLAIGVWLWIAWRFAWLQVEHTFARPGHDEDYVD